MLTGSYNPDGSYAVPSSRFDPGYTVPAEQFRQWGDTARNIRRDNALSWAIEREQRRHAEQAEMDAKDLAAQARAAGFIPSRIRDCMRIGNIQAGGEWR